MAKRGNVSGRFLTRETNAVVVMNATVRLVLLTTVTMVAFAANSLLNRAALLGAVIDASSFTLIRLGSGAAVLWLIVAVRSGSHRPTGSWRSALALIVYAAGFSFAYLELTAATGALLLFGAVQVTMIGHGLWSGERLRLFQIVGVILAIGGLVWLLLPGIETPPLRGSLLMITAGVAWGVYSLRGRGSDDPIRQTAGNFLRSVPIAFALALILLPSLSADPEGVVLAVVSGAVTSGLGYAVWYHVLPALRAVSAATVQLSVPVIASVGGAIILGEQLTLPFVLASAIILGGIAMVVVRPAD